MNDTGLVIRLDSRVCWVRTTAGSLRKCTIRGRLFQDAQAAKNPVAVGDRVSISVGEDPGDGRVDAVLPRKNKLSRPVADSVGRREQVIVANVDYLAVVVAAARPRLRPGLIDRYLIAAARAAIEPLVVINKIDLVDRRETENALSVYAKLDVRMFYTSAVDGTGLETLRAALAGRHTVFAGHSGVGKSTLLNALEPGLEIETQTVSRKSGKGVHTTTRVTMHELVGGGSLIDTPGVRAVGLWNVEPAEVDAFFDDIVDVAGRCRFRGCTHRHEPSCAVRAAVDGGEIDARRFESYVRIRESLEEEARDRGY